MRAELEPLGRSYDVVVANPPYMGAKNMNKWLSGWVKDSYPDVKGDLFSCFMVRNSGMGSEHAQMGFMTPYVWMFIGTYEKLRRFVIEQNTITSLIQLEYSGFAGATVPICTFTLEKGKAEGYKGGYIRLSGFPGADQQAPRALEALANPGCGWFYRRDADAFSQIPGSPIAYWTSNGFREAFVCGMPLGNLTDTHLGMATCDNNRFLREWWEVPASGLAKPANYPYDFTEVSWIPYCKGGSFRKWSGNDEWVVNWKNKGSQLENAGAVMVNDSLRFRAMDSWTRVSSGALAVRFKRQGYLFDMTGPGAFGSELDLKYVLAFLNSQVGLAFASFLSASLDFQPGQIGRYPLIKSSVEAASVEFAANKCIRLSSSDWDSFETSWEFERHPLI